MHRLYVGKQLFALFLLRNASIDLVTLLEAIMTRRQAREKLQCLYENLMSNNFR